MDKYIKQSIDARKNAFSASYKIDSETPKKIDALFTEIEKFGENCQDVGDFETKFTQSPLNQKYMGLFTEIATGGQVKATSSEVATVSKTVAVGATQTPKVSKGRVGKLVAEGAIEGVAGRAIEEAERVVLPTRAAVNQEISDAMRKVPVLGDAIDIGQKASYTAHLTKLFRKKKKA